MDLTKKISKSFHFSKESRSGKRDSHEFDLPLRARLDVLSKVVENSLPPLALLVDGVRSFGIKSLSDHRSALRVVEVHLYAAAIGDLVLEIVSLVDIRIRAFEVEAHTAVLRGHGRHEFAAYAQVVLSAWRMPIVRGECPLDDVLRRIPKFPDNVLRRVDNRRYRDRAHSAENWK